MILYPIPQSNNEQRAKQHTESLGVVEFKIVSSGFNTYYEGHYQVLQVLI